MLIQFPFRYLLIVNIIVINIANLSTSWFEKFSMIKKAPNEAFQLNPFTQI